MFFSQENFFKNQICSTDNEITKTAKHILGLSRFLNWINSFPENNIYFNGENERILSLYLSGFITLSKDNNTLYLGIQEREAQWLKYIPFYAACFDIDKAYLGLLSEASHLGEKSIPALNLAIKVSSNWRLKQLSQLRRLRFVGVKVQYGQVVEVFEESEETLNLYHQSMNSTVQYFLSEKNKKLNILSNIL